MRSHCGSRLGSSIVAASVLLVLAAPAAQAQPGFGPDPFWPYNNQYTPYVTPMGPADPAAGGQAGDAYARDGLRGANRFQEYLDDVQGGGPGRNLSDRSNIGMPYFRSAVDPTYAAGRSGLRQYQANSRSNETFEDNQRRVSDVYFRYYTERDPAKRAELLRQYRSARREAAVTISGRGRSPSQILDASTRMEAGIRRGTRSPSAAADRSRTTNDRFGPAPEVPAIGSRRSAAPSSSPRRTLPSDVLNRSRAMDRDSGILGPRRPGPALHSPGRRTDRSGTTSPAAMGDEP